MENLRDTIFQQTLLLAEFLSPQAILDNPPAPYVAALVNHAQQIAILGRYKNVQDVSNHPVDHWYDLDELHPWFHYQIPEMLSPLVVIDYEKYRLFIMPQIIENNDIDPANIVERISRYNLKLDILGDTPDTSHNLTYLEPDDVEVIFDQGALMSNYKLPSVVDENAITLKRRLLAEFTPYATHQPTHNDKQIKMWRRRGYDLRGIYDKAEIFAQENGGQVVLAPNPNILIPT